MPYTSNSDRRDYMNLGMDAINMDRPSVSVEERDSVGNFWMDHQYNQANTNILDCGW